MYRLKMKKKIVIMITGLVSVMLILTSCGGSAAETVVSANTNQVKAAQPEAGSEITFDESAAETAGSKEETVSVKADASGKPLEITSSVKLTGIGNGAFVKDESDLDNIRNTDGDEEYQQKDTMLLWENKGADISYEGDSSKTPDVGVEITYFLNGVRTEPEKMIGESGDVRIQFHYINNVKQEGMTVPYLFLTVAMLSRENFSDVEVKNGTVSSMDDMDLVAGLAVPGLKQELGLNGLEAAKDFELPEYVEITAKATDFRLDFTTTIVSSGLFKDLDTEKLKDAEDLISGMKDLQSASSEILNGISALSDGAGTFDSALKTYTDGAQSLSTGVDSLSKGADALSSNGESLLQGAQQISSGLKQFNDFLASAGPFPDTDFGEEIAGQLQEIASALETDGSTLAGGLQNLQNTFGTLGPALETMAASLQNAGNNLGTLQTELALLEGELQILKENGADTTACESHIQNAKLALEEAAGTLAAIQIPDLSDMDVSDIQAAAEDMGTQMELLKSIFEAYQGDESLSELAGKIEELKQALEVLSEGAGQLEEGIRQYTGGVRQVSEGTSALKNGAETLSSGGAELYKGYGALAEGIRQLESGYSVFDSEGIGELSNLAGDDLQHVLDRLKALKKIDNSSLSFSGASAETESDVRYMIETEELK